MHTDHSHSRVGKWALIIGIVIVLNLFFGYAVSLIYPAPQYTQFCPDSNVVSAPGTKQECLAVGGQWTDTTAPAAAPQNPPVAPSGGTIVKSAPATPVETGYCDPTYTCQQKYTAANTVYEKNIFIILIVLGVLSIGAGLFLNAGSAVSAGLSYGGLLSLVIASIRYWGEAGSILKVLILAIALLALLWLGAKKFKN